MADWVKVESQMRKLISDANTTTEKNDTNLTDCVGSLISGYVQGSGSGGTHNVKPLVATLLNKYESSGSSYGSQQWTSYYNGHIVKEA